MAKVEIILPAMGEGIIEATLTRWLVSEGTMVEEDDPIAEVATDKVDTEIPAPASGIIGGFAFKEGDIPKVGEIIAYIENDKVSEVSREKAPLVEQEFIQVKDLSLALKDEKKEVEKAGEEIMSRTTQGKYLSPLVRRIAAEEGISHADIDSIAGTGMDGRITRDDLLAFISNGKLSSEQQDHEETTKPVVPANTNPFSAPVKVSGFTEAGDEIIEMDRIRKLIAEHMVNSKRTSPHVTTFIDVDVTDIVNFRNRVKDGFLRKEGMKFTLTPIFFEATARTLRQFPGINISVEGTSIIRKKNINIGMATALPGGNLIVPVIKKADEKSLIGLTREVNDLAGRARQNKLKPDEITGGTFTITNYGTVGNLMGTPIINQPQCAILGIGAIRKMPAVIETPSGDTIGIRHILYLSLSYDHRVIDGALGGMFIRQLKDNLEAFASNAYLNDFKI